MPSYIMQYVDYFLFIAAGEGLKRHESNTRIKDLLLCNIITHISKLIMTVLLRDGDFVADGSHL